MQTVSCNHKECFIRCASACHMCYSMLLALIIVPSILFGVSKVQFLPLVPHVHNAETWETAQKQNRETSRTRYNWKAISKCFFPPPDGVQHIQRTSPGNPGPNCKRDWLHGLHYRKYPKRLTWSCFWPSSIYNHSFFLQEILIVGKRWCLETGNKK